MELFEAAKANDTKTIEALIESGIDVNTRVHFSLI
jgi:hypothetical protein